MPRAARTSASATSSASNAGVPALLLHGEERFLVDERARATLSDWTRELVSDFGLDTIEAAGLNAARLQDAILQAPFLDPHRVVFVRGVIPARSEALAPALGQIPPSTRLLITVNGKLGAANRLAKALTAAGGKVEEKPRLVRRALSDWATKRAVEQHGLTPAIAAQVVRLSPADLTVIDSELSKIAAYKASGARLTGEVVNELLAGGREEEMFRLNDHLLPHPTPHALDLARNLTRSGVAPTLIAWRMARHIALVLEVKARQQRGESLQQAQQAMPEHPFVVQKAFDVAQQSSEARLEDALNKIRDYEWEVKSGQVDADLGLDVLLTRL